MRADHDPQMQDLLRAIQPDSGLARTELRGVHPSAAGLFLIPSGGEAHGILTVTSVAVEDVEDAASALLALWKIDHCLGEEEDYAPWDPETVGWRVDGPFRQHLAIWLEAAEAGRPDAGKWLEWLRNGAEAVIEAQFGGATGAPPRNPPTYLPDEATVTASKLLDLHYLSLDVPHWILADDWNDAEGLFRFRGRWFFAEWGTNA